MLYVHMCLNPRFSLEMHLVHWKTSYGSVANAKAHPDGLAVLGILFEAEAVSVENEEDDPIEVGHAIFSRGCFLKRKSVPEFENPFKIQFIRLLVNELKISQIDGIHGYVCTRPK
jgi:hypothetical protein